MNPRKSVNIYSVTTMQIMLLFVFVGSPQVWSSGRVVVGCCARGQKPSSMITFWDLRLLGRGPAGQGLQPLQGYGKAV